MPHMRGLGLLARRSIRATGRLSASVQVMAARQPFEYVDLGTRHRRHEALHEGAVGLVDQPLRLRRDRAEHQRALAPPETPVTTVSRRFGIATLTSLRLFTRAPCTRIKSRLPAACSTDGYAAQCRRVRILGPLRHTASEGRHVFRRHGRRR